MQSFDYVLVGGGLHNGLCAVAIAHGHPGAHIALLESGDSLGGNHTWSFHAPGDGDGDLAWLDNLIVHRWPAQDLLFPQLCRTLALPYGSITSERLDAVLRALLARPGNALLLRRTVVAVQAHEAVCSDGTRVQGEVVIDARGPQALGAVDCGYQKFVGLELETAGPHGIERPVLMDARVEQHDGYRFVYVLPFSTTRCLVEDTRFSNGAELAAEDLRRQALQYLASRGIAVETVIRQEQGVLPMTWSWIGPDEAPHASPLRAGYAAGWFHPATGYSLPCAVQLAQHLGTVRVNDVFGAGLQSLWCELREQARFAHVLNWLLFHTVQPGLRWEVFERFHALPVDTIARFYAMRTTARDRLRILTVRPPRGLSLRLLWNSITNAARSKPTPGRSQP